LLSLNRFININIKIMSKQKQSVSANTDAKEVVQSFINAINAEDFDKARGYVTHDLVFVGVMVHEMGQRLILMT
jgi:ketosteroid isomerase-like protein